MQKMQKSRCQTRIFAQKMQNFVFFHSKIYAKRLTSRFVCDIIDVFIYLYDLLFQEVCTLILQDRGG